MENNEFRENNQKYEIKNAYNYFVNMKKDLYPDINKYLTTLDDPTYRGISK